MSKDLYTVYFIIKFGPEKTQIPVPAAPNLKFKDIIPELSKKVGIEAYNLSISTVALYILTENDLNKTVREVVEKFGNTFQILNRDDVGNESIPDDHLYHQTILDQQLSEFPPEIASITPKDGLLWDKRIKIEIQYLMKLLNYLKLYNGLPWFRLYPEKTRKYKYLVWGGYISIPEKPEIKFDIKVLITSEYPKACPRCFIDKEIEKYSDKIFLKNIWKQDGKTYKMICHEHITKKNVWKETFGIAHFLIRQIWIWFAVQQNYIMAEYEKHQCNK